MPRRCTRHPTAPCAKGMNEEMLRMRFSPSFRGKSCGVVRRTTNSAKIWKNVGVFFKKADKQLTSIDSKLGAAPEFQLASLQVLYIRICSRNG